MIVRTVSVYVKPDIAAEFEAATEANHRGSIEEPGVFRFDVMRDESTAGRYLLYEVYRDTDAVAAHKETAHYQAWRDTVAPMMAKPRSGEEWSLIYPAGD